MDPAHQSSASLPPPSPTRQNKAMLQREYREKEQECFNTLRDIIKDLTGEELRTRQEILRKATEVLSSEHRKQEGAQVSAANAYYEARSGSVTNHVHDDTHHAMDNSIQLADWYPSGDLDPAMFNDGTHIYDEQYNIPDMNSASNQPRSQHGWDWSNHF